VVIDKTKLAFIDARIETALALLHTKTDKCAPARECWALEDKLNDLRVERAKLVCQKGGINVTPR
jgi:hypothetical protein